MPVPSGLVGVRTTPITHAVDARWLMAYAAALGDTNPRYLDTLGPDGIVGHPLFSVCPEWPVVLAARDLAAEAGVPLDELRRGVHATHDTHLHRLVRPGDELTTVATITSVEQRRPGAYLVMRLDTTDASGAPVTRTWQGSLYLGVSVDGADRALVEPPALPEGPEPSTGSSVNVPAGMAHVYTECAHIWNPIHTDRTAAKRAGLPDIILHGTATHALAVSDAVDRWAGGEPARVQRVTGRFGAMVRMPSTITISTGHGEGRTGGAGAGAGAVEVVSIEVRNEDGDAAVRDGFVVLAPTGS